MINQVKGKIAEYKSKFEAIKNKVEDTINKYGGKWIAAGIYIKDHGQKCYDAGKKCLDACKTAHRGSGRS